MRAIIQRVSYCRIEINGEKYSEIGRGALIFLGITNEDTQEKCAWLANKIIEARIFSDELGKMNLSLKDVGGELMIVSQMTLYGEIKKGKRPSFNKVASSVFARPIYEKFVEICKSILGDKVKTGLFGTMMKVHLINDGPVTFILEI